MKVIIEIPEGDDRRRHLKYDRSGFVDLGSIEEKIPVNGGIMPVDYGYVPGTESKTEEKDELDVLLISSRIFKVGEEVEARPIALMRRDDGDDKIVAVDTDSAISEWVGLPDSLKAVIVDFFGYHHHFTAIESARTAAVYIEECRSSARH